MKTNLMLLVLLPLWLLISGCDTTRAKSRELARVAKDWSLVVRASQVIPVYPLTEDLQPGDVFLVRSRLEDQISEYEAKGFLSLDQLLTRLQPTNYGGFYLRSHGIGTNTNTPYHWKFPVDATNTNELQKAPRAAFPSYNFSVRRGAGINVALPVQGIPVALNMMGSGSANGSITIADAYTYGVDMFTLRRQIENWEKDNGAFLKQYEPTGDGTNYLRVVNRVYWTGRVNISMINDQAYSGAASGGASKPVSLIDLASTNAAGNYTNAIRSLNDSLESAALPGGTLKVAAASSRSVSLVETFPRPLAIGYLGFDLPILAEGKLGALAPTQARLIKTKLIAAKETTYGTDDNSAKIENWLRGEGKNRAALRDWLQKNGFADHGITNIIKGEEYRDLRLRIVRQFKIN